MRVSKLIHRLGSLFWLGFTLFDATIFSALALLGFLTGQYLFAFTMLVTGVMFCAGGMVLYRYCKLMLNLIHQNEIANW